MIIICPNCSAQYNLAPQAIGSAGRKVKCAQCATNWRAMPEPIMAPKADEKAFSLKDDDSLFDALAETQLDQEFAAEQAKAAKAAKKEAEKAALKAKDSAASPAKEADAKPDGAAAAGAKSKDANAKSAKKTAPDPDEMPTEPRQPEDEATLRRRREALQKRHAVLARNLPRSRMRRWVRMVMAVFTFSFFGTTFIFKNQIVTEFPQLAVIYQTIGMDVNVVGLDFENVETFRTLRDGAETLVISAELVNITSRPITVPRVLVSLQNEEGGTIYQWTAVPQARALRSEERLLFTTQLVSPPENAVDLSLSFDRTQDEN